MKKFTHNLLGLLALGALGTPALHAQYTSANRSILTPNNSTAPVGGVTLGGTTFINLGLQGVGRFAANSTDPNSGESIGSFSGMQISGFTNNGNGTYSGTLHTLPDRGYNTGATYSNFAARINSFDFSFTPYTSSATTTNQNQIALTFTSSTRFTYDHDNNSGTASIFTTGILPGTTNGSLFGKTIPVAPVNTTNTDGTFASRLTVDAEAIALDTRSGKAGSGWIGDEYGANVYHFNASKEIDGILGQPGAEIPRLSGTTNFVNDPPTDGRRINQGLEGVASSPDGNKLFALYQSATIQDSGSGNVGRSNTRLLVYDVSSSDAPAAATKEYVIQLPLIDDNGGSPAVNRTGAQSEIVALNDHQILILSRDGNGRGATGSPVFKSILLADLSAATDITGSFDAPGSAVAPGGTLNVGVTPITWTEALNLLGKVDLGVTEFEQFGFNYSTAPGDINTVSEKWEALSLVSAQDPFAPNDYFLFVANDNDFLTGSTKMLDEAGTLQSYTNAIENDTVVLAYRVTVVPEPSTVALLLGAGVGLLALARRNRRA